MNFLIKDMSLLIFTDIDGTFINNDTFDEGLNTKTVSELVQAQHSVVFNTSKTFDEVDYFQKKIKTSLSFICETGGGIYLANDSLKTTGSSRGAYQVLYESRKITEYKDKIQSEINKNYRDDLTFFDDLSDEEKSSLSGLSGHDLALASRRDFSILIKWKSTKSKYDEFKLFLKKFKLNLITGGRFSHICSEHDKGKATKLFIDKTKKFYNNTNIFTVGIGDSKNDFEMLNEVDFPCIVKSPNNHLLQDSLNSKNITFSDHEAPNGWIECIEKVITKIKSSEIANV
jgi:mannosyl-3-phosphoglycerate phosphatase